MTIIIVPPNPHWVDEFERLAAPPWQVLSNLALRIDRIGSTAVPGLIAKDIIDIQVKEFSAFEKNKNSYSNALSWKGFWHG